MKLEITKDLNLNNYSATFKIVDITSVDQSKIEDFGILKLSIGGDIPLSVGTFKVDDDIKAFPTDFPFTKTFKDSQTNGKGKEYALAYIAEITKRVETLITELNAKVDDYSGVELIQL